MSTATDLPILNAPNVSGSPAVVLPEFAHLGPVPLELPPRVNSRGKAERMKHLSMSALGDLLCPEHFRRKRILKHDWTKTGAMMIGNTVEDGITHAVQSIIRGDKINVSDALDAYEESWPRTLRDEGVDPDTLEWATDKGIDERTARDGGRRAVELYVRRVLPGYLEQGWVPIEAQRSFLIKLHPMLEWSIKGALDFVYEYQGPDTAAHGARLIVDTKARATSMAASKAETDVQADLYLAVEAREGVPAVAFAFHSINFMAKKPSENFQFHSLGEYTIEEPVLDEETGEPVILKSGPNKGQPKVKKTKAWRPGASIAIHNVERELIEHKRSWERMISAAQSIDMFYAARGPDMPWPFMADPGHWRCTSKFCDAYAGCPGGGLYRSAGEEPESDFDLLEAAAA